MRVRLKGFFSAASILIVSSMTCATSHVYGESFSDKFAFFTQGSVSDLTVPMEETEQREFEYYTTAFKIEEDKPAKADVNQVAAKGTDAKTQQAPAGVDPQKFALSNKFGDPKEEVTVKAVDTAHKSYQGMLEAIEMGRDDLALEYAEQWSSYLKKLERVTRKATSLAGVAQAKIGVAGPDRIDENAVANIDPEALKKYLSEKSPAADGSSVETLDIDEQEQASIKSLFADESDSPPLVQREQTDPYANLVDKSIEPQTRRQLIHAKLAGSLPRDSSGQVQILFFVRPTDERAIEIGKELAQTLGSSVLGGSLSIVPLSIDGYSAVSSNVFSQKTGLPVILKDGSQLMKSLGLKEAPVMVFVAPTSSSIFVKYGFSDSVFIEEVSRLIGGR